MNIINQCQKQKTVVNAILVSINQEVNTLLVKELKREVKERK